MGQTYRKMYLLVSQRKEKDFEIRTFLFVLKQLEIQADRRLVSLPVTEFILEILIYFNRKLTENLKRVL